MKLTKEEVDQLSQIKSSTERVVNEFGQISISEESLKQRKSRELEFLDQLKAQENQLAKTLEDKYGKGSVNIDSGEFIPL